MQKSRLPAPAARRIARVALIAGAVLAGLGAGTLGGCSGPKREVKAVAPVVRDVPSVLRGTIGAEASIRGTEPVLVSGLGVVVNLNGTGGGNLDTAIAATMERELARNGIGRGSSIATGPLEGLSPQEFLRHPNVAVVIVEARIPPGAPEGAPFDVFVRALPNSTVSSLEGGLLWTTELRIGPAAVYGSYKTRKLAEARGPIYINPFSDRGVDAPGQVTITRTVGRVLGGGRVTDPLKMELILDNDSHSRARSVVAALNTRFPKGPGDKEPTARGRGQEQVKNPQGEVVNAYQSIAISVPSTFKEDPAEFLQLLRYTRIDQSYPQEYARQYVEELKARPGMSTDLAWCLRALGPVAVPFLVPMYEYPEFAPRMAALEAGAALGDARAVPHLAELARSGPPGLRTDAIRLLSDMPSNPSINMALRELLDAPELEVRVAAYEGLSRRRDPLVWRVPVGIDPIQPKFILEMVPARQPLVYVTQQGEPRIVLFGQPNEGASGSRRGAPRIALKRPMLVSAWDNRLMFSAESEGDVRMYYRNPRTGEAIQQKVKDDLFDLIQFLAHKPTPEAPEPGLDFSYSDVVGAIYELSRQGGIAADFATEEDRLRAEIFEAARSTMLNERPESSDGSKEEPVQVFQPVAPAGARPEPKETGEPWKPRVVPLNKSPGNPKS